MRNIYRFEFDYEFSDDFLPGHGSGVYVEGLPCPFILFVDWRNCEGRRGWNLVCWNGKQDGIWGVFRWIDEPPAEVKALAEKEYTKWIDFLQADRA